MYVYGWAVFVLQEAAEVSFYGRWVLYQHKSLHRRLILVHLQKIKCRLLHIVRFCNLWLNLQYVLIEVGLSDRNTLMCVELLFYKGGNFKLAASSLALSHTSSSSPAFNSAASSLLFSY